VHIIIAFLTALGAIIWALYRLQDAGVKLNAFNPFYWLRRRRWQNQVNTKPLHRLDKPLDAAAVLVTAAVKTEGEISREQKQEVIGLFEHEFNLEHNAAAELFAASAHLLHDANDIVAEVRPILATSKEHFNSEQVSSLLVLIKQACCLDGALSRVQSELIEAVRWEFTQAAPDNGKWT
jgi:uncharacterized tellurite resistance protein B-like protein